MRTPTVTPPAGWYPDPERAGNTRYWDGHAWGAQEDPVQAEVESTVPGDTSELAVTLPETETEAEVTDEAAEAEIAGSRPDIQTAVRRMGRTLGIKRELRTLESRLDPRRGRNGHRSRQARRARVHASHREQEAPVRSPVCFVPQR